MKRFLILAVILFLIPIKGQALSAASAILIDAGSGRVLFESNAYKKMGMASTTKIMTAIVALEKCKMDEVVTVSAHAAATEGSSIWLVAGEHIKMEDLLYGLMLNSGNDAATAIAEHISGDTKKFSELMNEMAGIIGAENTHFTNPHGLADENHYTTAYDLALIARYALQNPTFARIVATKSKTIPKENEKWGRILSNHNKMLLNYKGADGVKTGFTKATGRTLVSSATRDGMQIIAVTLNAPDDWADHAAMLDQGFAKYDGNLPFKQGEVVQEIDSTATAVIYSDLSIALTKEELKNVSYNDIINLPKKIENNSILGYREVRLYDKVVCKVLITAKVANDNGEEDERTDTFAENFGKLWHSLSTQSGGTYFGGGS